jgi:hypothetical protein
MTKRQPGRPSGKARKAGRANCMKRKARPVDEFKVHCMLCLYPTNLLKKHGKWARVHPCKHELCAPREVDPREVDRRVPFRRLRGSLIGCASFLTVLYSLCPSTRIHEVLPSSPEVIRALQSFVHSWGIQAKAFCVCGMIAGELIILLR